jgi:ADP-ribose pyrophosphatase YjhB (NUDIX family)
VTVYVNAIVESDDRRLLALWNRSLAPGFWALPGGPSLPTDTALGSCLRWLEAQCLVEASAILPFGEGKFGEDRILLFRCLVEKEPVAASDATPICAMAPDELAAQSPFKLFYQDVFKELSAVQLYCIHCERKARGTWNIELNYAHGRSAAEAEGHFRAGEWQAMRDGSLRIVSSGLTVGYKVADREGKILLA